MTKANRQARLDAVAATLFFDLQIQEKEDPEFNTMKQYQP